jgi:hypothetical protein
MEELKFVMKSLVFTMLLVMLMQIRVGQSTIETHTFRWLRQSTVSQYIQSAAAGGAMGLRRLGGSLKENVSSTWSGFQEGAHEKAVR